jgi:hypothetical protein
MIMNIDHDDDHDNAHKYFIIMVIIDIYDIYDEDH